jgi:hypothetical protein
MRKAAENLEFEEAARLRDEAPNACGPLPRRSYARQYAVDKAVSESKKWPDDQPLVSPGNAVGEAEEKVAVISTNRKKLIKRHASMNKEPIEVNPFDRTSIAKTFFCAIGRCCEKN